MLPEHRADPDLVAVAVAQNPAALDFASCSRPLLLSVLRANGRALQYASKGGARLSRAPRTNLQSGESGMPCCAINIADAIPAPDKEVVLAAVQNQPAALQHASIALRDDEEVVHLGLEAMNVVENPFRSRFAAASGEPKALQFASERLRSDAQFVRSLRKAGGKEPGSSWGAAVGSCQ
eukprot:Skav231180  [mRNA]  locus=scaffold425:27269:34951:+ [translate_table: standard]